MSLVLFEHNCRKVVRHIVAATLIIAGSTIAIGQFHSYVDLVPFVVECDVEQTLAEAVQCSEQRLRGYFLSNIDTTACPATDTAALVQVTLEVADDGGYSARVSGRKLRATCLGFFEKKAAAMPEVISLFPAELDRSPVPYHKSVKFYQPPLTAPTQVSDSTEAFTFIEQMPRFYDAQCEQMLGGPSDKSKCAATKMLQYIYSHLKYPKAAKENDIEGTVVVRFVVNKEGYIEDAEIVREIGGKCGLASLLVVNQMNHQEHSPFVPGLINGQPVNVQYSLPMRFRLER